jgi:hypothetical protein
MENQLKIVFALKVIKTYAILTIIQSFMNSFFIKAIILAQTYSDYNKQALLD